MLRRIPFTPLVCLVIFLSTILVNESWAANPEEALEILLKPNQARSSAVAKRTKARPRPVYQARPWVAGMPSQIPPPPFFKPISKVKAPCGGFAPIPFPRGCALPRAKARQWELSVQAIFARTRGTIAWPRRCYTNFNQNNEIDLNDIFNVPEHATIPQFTARYQFRPHWAVRYTILGAELSGGGNTNQWNQQYCFGNSNILISGFQDLNSKWTHTYQRLGLVYDAISTCSTVMSVFADWLHTDDKLEVGCQICGQYTRIFSTSGDSAIVGLEFQRCIKTARNGGTLSWDHKAGVIFLDDVQGWDIQLGLRYSIPLNCGRAGFASGGYRFITYEKSQPDYLWENTLEGGYMEFGLIF
jgi:hypothetical protein